MRYKLAPSQRGRLLTTYAITPHASAQNTFGRRHSSRTERICPDWHNGRKYYVGRFDSLREAEEAVTTKRNELFTHNALDRY